MRGANTKDRILDAALELFASRGYEEVSMQDIASAVDIKAPSLYKHYAGKQEIYDSLVKRAEKTFYEFSAPLGISTEVEGTAQGMLQFDVAKLQEMGMMLFSYLLHDENTLRFRRMLAMRQYSNASLADLYIRMYITQPMHYQGAVAAAMAQTKGVPESEIDAELLGLEFYAPIFLLINRCDIDPGYEPEARRLLEKHMQRFFDKETKR